MFTKIEDATMSARVAQQIQQLIVENQLRPGERLPSEKALCDELGVSRTVVREAIRGLVAKGLLDVSPGRGGTTVRQPTPETTTESMLLYLTAGRGGLDFEKVLEVRRVLEPGIAALAAQRRTEADLCALERLLEPIDVRDEAGETAFRRQDQDFHEALARATHNDIFVLLMAAMSEWMLELRRKAAQVVRRAPHITKRHWAIYECIRARDAAGATDAMIAHLDEAERIQRAALNLPQLNRTRSARQ